MCQYLVKVQGIKVCGRSVYVSDTGVKIGYRGPTVPLAVACADLEVSKASYLRESWQIIAYQQQEAALRYEEEEIRKESIEEEREMLPHLHANHHEAVAEYASLHGDGDGRRSGDDAPMTDEERPLDYMDTHGRDPADTL